MKIGSLFSGYGGLDMAALQLFPGSEVAWHCEWEPAPSKILAHHWPTVPNFHDVTKLDWDALPEIDVLTGGYPCQPFSAAGRRKGTADERHLWPYVLHAIRRLRPRYTLLENVAGHRSMGFDRVLGDCAEDGLHVRWTSLRASDVGACHKRERLFILITSADAHSNAIRVEPVAEPRGRGQTEPGRVGADAADAEGDGRYKGRPESKGQFGRSDASECGVADAPNPTSDGRPRVDDGTSSSGARTGRQRQSRGGAGCATAPVALLPTPSTADGMGGHLTRSGSRATELLLPGVAKAYAEGKLLPTPNASDSSGGGQHPSKRVGHSRQLIDYALLDGSPEWGDYAPAIRRQEALSRPAPSPTMTSRKGNPQLSPAFVEWMQFLPAGHVTDPAIGLSRNDELKALGNGVCPPQAVAAYRPMLQAVMA